MVDQIATALINANAVMTPTYAIKDITSLVPI